MTLSPREARDQRDRQRFIILNALRFGGLAMVLFGIAITQGVLALPWPVGAVLAVVGLIDFFFVPLLIARRWKAADAAGDDQPR